MKDIKYLVKNNYIVIYMPGIVLGFDNNTNDYFYNLYTQINSIEPLLKTDIVPHISLMRFQDINEIKKISSILKDISFTDFKVKINGTSIYKKSESKFVLVLEPFYEENISKIHRLIWEKLEDEIELKEKNFYSPTLCSLHLTINLIEPNKTNLMKVLDNLIEISRETFQIQANKILVIDKGTIHYKKLFTQTGNGLPLKYYN